MTDAQAVPPRPPDRTDRHTLLSIYLNDHLAGAAAGVALIRRIAHENRGAAMESDLQEVAEQVEQDHGTLLEIAKRLGVRKSPVKAPLALLAERVARLKLNGQIRGRSPLSNLVELETMRLAVQGKLSGWRTLLEITTEYPALDPVELNGLIERARSQSDRLEKLRVRAACHALVFVPPADPR